MRYNRTRRLDGYGDVLSDFRRKIQYGRRKQRQIVHQSQMGGYPRPQKFCGRGYKGHNPKIGISERAGDKRPVPYSRISFRV